MTYVCRCADGPAKDKEFRDYGPSVVIEVRHDGQVLKYGLVSVSGDVCAYHFRGVSDMWDSPLFTPFKETDALIESGPQVSGGGQAYQQREM